MAPDGGTPLNKFEESERWSRVVTSESIVVESSCGGESQIYEVVSGQIPSDLLPLLKAPFTDEERDRIFSAVNLYGAEKIPSPRGRPRALWIFGPPAVGKSTIGQELSIELFGRPDNAVIVDGNNIRDEHLGFRKVSQHAFKHGFVLIDAWNILKEEKHVENLKKEIATLAVNNRQNLIIPECALKPGRVRKMLASLEDAGYELHATCLWAPMEETQVRGRARSLKAGKAFSTQFYAKSSQGALEFAKLWECKLEEESPHYKSITYFDNTVMPSRQIHMAEFEMLTGMSRDEARQHAHNCRTAKAVYEKSGVGASQAFAHGKEQQALDLAEEAPTSLARRGSSQGSALPQTEVAEGIETLLYAQKARGILEGFVLGGACVLFAGWLLQVLNERRRLLRA